MHRRKTQTRFGAFHVTLAVVLVAVTLLVVLAEVLVMNRATTRWFWAVVFLGTVLAVVCAVWIRPHLPVRLRVWALVAFVSWFFTIALTVQGWIVSGAATLGVDQAHRAGVRWVTGRNFAPSLVEQALVLVGLAYLTRRWLLERLVYKPGAVEVRPFEAGSAGVPVNAVMSAFRTRLAEVRISAPTAVPGATASTELFELVRSGPDKSAALSRIASILLLMLSPRAYRVSGVAYRRPETDGGLPCAISVQMEILPHQAGSVETHSGNTCEEAADRAAQAVTALILPGTRRGHEEGWDRAQKSSPSAFRYHQEAQQLARERRYDEALGRYFEALQEDPENLTIRLDVADLQSELGLFLPALETYLAVVSGVDAENATARYRLGITLGFVEELVEQWCDAPESQSLADRTNVDPRTEAAEDASQVEHGGDVAPFGDNTRARIANLAALRKRLLLALEKRGHRGGDLLGNAMTRPSDTEKRKELGQFFLDAAGRELEQLLPLVKPDVPPTRQSVNLAQYWTTVRGNRGGESFEDVKSKITGIDRRHWQDHYNAACVYALGITTKPGEELTDQERPFVDASLECLEMAVRESKGGFALDMRDWLLNADPDLTNLRAQPGFQAFEARHFPSPNPSGIRVPRPQRYEDCRYARSLLSAAAARIEDRWHGRARASDETADVHVLRAWWEDERRLWKAVGDVSKHAFQWQCRLQFLTTVRSVLELEPAALSVEFPSVATLHDEQEAVGTVIKEEQHLLERTYEDAEKLRPLTHELEMAATAWRDHMRDLDRSGDPTPDAVALAFVASSWASAWQSLTEWFESPIHEGTDRLNGGSEKFAASVTLVMESMPDTGTAAEHLATGAARKRGSADRTSSRQRAPKSRSSRRTGPEGPTAAV